MGVSWKCLWAEHYSERWGIGVLLRPLPFSTDVSKSVLVSGLFISFESLDRSWHFETGNRSKICVCFPLPQCSHLDSSVGRAITNPKKGSGPLERLVQVFENKRNKGSPYATVWQFTVVLITANTQFLRLPSTYFYTFTYSVILHFYSFFNG